MLLRSDIFSGSNTTGQVAEAEGRQWFAFEELAQYVGLSAFRFLDKGVSPETMQQLYDDIVSGQSVVIEDYCVQAALAL